MPRIALLAMLCCSLALPAAAAARGGGGGGGGTATTGGTLSSVSVTPSTIAGGSSATGKATFTAGTTDGAVLNISSSNPAVAQVPAQVVVPRGVASGTFSVTTSTVTTSTPVTITVLTQGVTRSTTITVSPGAAPAADTVGIKKAECKPIGPGGLVAVEATSTNPNAILGVYGSSGVLLFTLSNNGGGRYSGSKGFIDCPHSVTVRSNFGGVAGPVSI
jgi:hypothetical protein